MVIELLRDAREMVTAHYWRPGVTCDELPGAAPAMYESFGAPAWSGLRLPGMPVSVENPIGY